jgi:cobalt-precorrin 5A hydrolase / cobalt-factor III methyltransferase / precorrin-3B C17-methyltransferase
VIALVAATKAGLRLAADLAAHVDGKVVQGRAPQAVMTAWRETDQLVLVMAAGAAVRLLAPLLSDKHTDPGVVCVDDAGRFAVALVGGHEGGANALAERIATYLGAMPVVTTGTETRGLAGLADLGLPVDAKVADLAAVGGAVVSGEVVHVVNRPRWPLGPLPDNVVEVTEPDVPLLWVTDRLVDPPRPAVVLRPPSLVVGVGGSRGVPADEVVDLVERALYGLSPRSVHCLATIEAKADEPGIMEAAVRLGVPLVAIHASRLAAVTVPNPSQIVAAAVGTPSVAEAAALHLGGELLVAKRKSAMATVAIARRPPRGAVLLVSLGPGAPDAVTGQVRGALARAEVVIGYGPYVDQAAPLLRRGTRCERYELCDEVARARRAIALAREGRRIAVVSSGDVGIYAMASPTLELCGDDVDVEVLPGVTAASAAAAALGSPLGNDHCAISLSDLLTPWEVIRRRVKAAAEGDLVVSLYNPRSARRDWQLTEARLLLLEHRSPTTPVGVVTDVTRPGQRVRLCTLATLDPSWVDMRTLVVVGNSQTRVLAGRMVTPRGYQ